MIPVRGTRYHAVSYPSTDHSLHAKPVYTTEHASPIGTLTLAADIQGLRHIVFPDGSRSFRTPAHWQPAPEKFVDTISQLDEYFAGKRTRFTLPLYPQGTDFQQSVWDALQQVGYGHTTSYGQIAKQLGKPAASRAVGAANGANPIPIVIPCHRVIGASGKLTGFGGGLPTKQWLLAHERGEGQLFAFGPPTSP